MASYEFQCIDGHTCGNPVRLIITGHPPLDGGTQSERRQHFLKEYDWIRTGLMFEPRGHAQMSGAFLYPSTRADCDTAVLFIETTGCLPMCGHGTIGVVTIAIERGLVEPKTPGMVHLDTPAGKVTASYTISQGRVRSVKITNVPSFLYRRDLSIDYPPIGRLRMDIAYGGNFYPIIEQQENYRDLSEWSPLQLIQHGKAIQELVNETVECVHPEDASIRGVRHLLWTGKATKKPAWTRNAVIYGDTAIDRSPCGTGTSARMAQLYSQGRLGKGDTFVHESIIGSLFRGEIRTLCRVGDFDAIVPDIEGWARITGDNRITIDEDDPYAFGFTVT